MTTNNSNTAVNAQALNLFDRLYAATLRRQSWSQTRAVERRIRDAEPIWTHRDNGDSEPWDWISGEYAAVYCLPKYGIIAYHRTGAGISALYAVNPWSFKALADRTTDLRCEGFAEFLRFGAVELAHSHN